MPPTARAIAVPMRIFFVLSVIVLFVVVVAVGAGEMAMIEDEPLVPVELGVLEVVEVEVLALVAELEVVELDAVERYELLA